MSPDIHQDTRRAAHASSPLHTTAPTTTPAVVSGGTAVLLIDQPITRLGIEQIITATTPLTVIAALAGIGHHTQDTLTQHAQHADLIVADLWHPPHAIRDATINKVTTMARHSTVLLIVPDNDPATLHLADTTGAHGFITRSAEPDQLATALNTLRGGRSYISPNLLEHLTHPHSPTSTPCVLARREIETLRWLAYGLTHRQIARRMNLTEATISTYVKHIRAKLHAGNKAELTRKAIELGYLGVSIPAHLAATA